MEATGPSDSRQLLGTYVPIENTRWTLAYMEHVPGLYLVY